MKNDLISVIVPIYGVEKYLEKCVDSIINQSYKNLEIILVDDGSPDKCGEICDEYKKKDDRIIVIHKKNGGLSDARNQGIQQASGKYLMFIDSDDFIDCKMVEKLYKMIKNDKSSIGICNRYDYYEYKEKNNTIISSKSNIKHIVMDFEKAMIELCSFNLFDMSACSKIYDSNLFSDIEFPVGKLSEDYYVMYKLFEKCERISYTQEPLYYYTQRKGSISRGYKINYDYQIAAKEQMEYITLKYKHLEKYVRSAYALANMTIFNWYIKNKRTLPPYKEYKSLKREVKNNIIFIRENERISKARKIQSELFIISELLYSAFFIVFKVLKRK